MSKEWPDVPALLTEADRADEDVFNVARRERDLIRRLADALEIMHDLYLQESATVSVLTGQLDDALYREGHDG